MRCSWWGFALFALTLAGRAFGQSATTPPPAPSYAEIESAIAAGEKHWQTEPGASDPNAAAWISLFNTVKNDLHEYVAATDADARVAALGRLHQTVAQLDTTSWPAATEIREDLRYWLVPRTALAWAEYNTLDQYRKGTPERAQWDEFIEKSERPAVSALENSKTVEERAQAIEQIDNVIRTLRENANLPANSQTGVLLGSLSALYAPPNVELTIDHAGLSSLVLPKGIVEAGPVFFKGQWSYVTPGPVQGVGFSPTADGVQVVVQQALTSITPIQGFQQQMEAADPRARQATSMYSFAATSRDDAVLTMVALFRLGTGLQLAPGYQHAVNAAITTTPVPGAGMKRLIAGLIGQNQQAITDKVYEESVTKMRDQVSANARELSTIRTSESTARVNSQIRPYILNDQTVSFDRFGVTDLRLTTGANHASAAGNLYSVDAPRPQHAPAPRPRKLATIQPGITADLHLPSVLANVTEGVFARPDVQNTSSIQIDATAGPDGVRHAPVITTNVEFNTYLAAVKAAVAEGKQPEIIRVLKPSRAPEYAASQAGELLVTLTDFQLDVPAPAQAARGLAGAPPASVYRIKAARAVFGLTVQLDRSNPAVPPALKARLSSLSLDPSSTVTAIQDQEETGTALNAILARVVLVGLNTKVVGQEFDLPVAALNRPEFSLADIAPLDPSGWLRLILSVRPAA